MSGARKAKPTKLKDSVESGKASGFDVKQFFGKAVSLVPFQPPTPEAQAYADGKSSVPDLEDKTMVLPRKVESQAVHLSVTQVTEVKARKSQTTSHSSAQPSTQSFHIPSTTNVSKQKSNAKWISPDTKPKVAAKEKEKGGLSPLLFLLPAIALVAYVFLSPGASEVSSGKISGTTLQERVDFHRKSTGWKLNRERIDVQYDNLKEAPGLAAGAAKVKAPDMMHGLPLQGERDVTSPTRDRMMPENPSYADTRIMYGLQEEQNRIEVEKRAEAAYIKELIANAHKDGYDLRVDKFGNVKAKRLPADELESQVPEVGGSFDGSYTEP